MVYKLLTKKPSAVNSSPTADPKPKYPLLTKRTKPTESTEDLALRLYEITKKQKVLKAEYEGVKQKIFGRVSEEGRFAVIETPEGPKEACYQKSETPVLIEDMKKAKRRLGEEIFMKVVRLSVSLLREVAGEAALKKVKVDTKEAESIHFYDYKDE